MKDQDDFTLEELKNTNFITLISKKPALYTKFKAEMHREITELNMTEFLTNTIEDEISSVLTKVGFQQNREKNLICQKHFTIHNTCIHL